MINLNSNGKINGNDVVYLVRHLLLVLSSIALGYTISDMSTDIHKMFTTTKGQFIAIFVFLMSGLVKFKDNRNILQQTAFMFILSTLSVFILQSLKKKIENNKKE